MEDAIETTKTPFPDTLDAAKRRAAIAIFKGIEAAAAKGDGDFPGMFDLATAFKNVSDSLPRETESIDAEPSPSVAALNWFFGMVQHEVGIADEPPRYPTMAQEVGHVLGLLRGKQGALESTVTNLRNELEAANAEVAEVRGELATLQSKLAAEVEARATLFSELCTVDALLNYAKTWTTYTAPIVTYGQRKDVIKSLAERAEVLKGVQDELAKTELDKRMHPANAVGIIVEQRNEARVALFAEKKDSKQKLVQLMGEMVDLMDFWRRGDEAFKSAASSLKDHLKAAFGDEYYSLVTMTGRQRSAISASAALNDAAKDEDVSVDLASAPFPMGHEPKRVAPDNTSRFESLTEPLVHKQAFCAGQF